MKHKTGSAGDHAARDGESFDQGVCCGVSPILDRVRMKAMRYVAVFVSKVDKTHHSHGPLTPSMSADGGSWSPSRSGRPESASGCGQGEGMIGSRSGY